ncbi:hypothetical protein C8R47DRAFT_1091422 [Mycena vitilis]|nr:hypothetical protein C8R47DRAFT_1091422 [Mycena vitilis]
MLPSSSPLVHSLPTETLFDVFRLAVAATLKTTRRSRAPSLETELAHIANAPLLTLSRVCSRWHTIAINTPTLWSNININDVALRGRTRAALEKTLTLLSVCLQRSGAALLSVSLRCRDGEPPHARIFDLLVQQSHRWETVHIGCSLRGIDTLVLRGRLPCLKSLTFQIKPETVDFLDIVPRLETLAGVPAPLLNSEYFGALLRCQRPRLLACEAISRSQSQAAISLLPKLSATTRVHLTIDRDSRLFQPHWTLSLHLPAVTAPISSLLCAAINQFHPHHLTSALSQIFASITLPNLQQMTLACGVYPQLVLEWPHTEFLALCARSNLGRSLKILQITEVRIAEWELRDILFMLPALEHLEVGDVPASAAAGNNSESAVITDSFLRAMTCAPGEDCLVPRLSYLACASRLVFTPSCLVDFVASRLSRHSEATSRRKLHVCIYPLPESDARSNFAVRTRLRELAAGHQHFVFQAGERYISQRRR